MVLASMPLKRVLMITALVGTTVARSLLLDFHRGCKDTDLTMGTTN